MVVMQDRWSETMRSVLSLSVKTNSTLYIDLDINSNLALIAALIHGEPSADLSWF